MQIVTVVGNPRPESRTHGLARVLALELAHVLPDATISEVNLAGKTAVPVLLGGAPTHQLAVDLHFTPLLLELGAAVPVRGLFVLESEVEGFAAFAAPHPAMSGP